MCAFVILQLGALQVILVGDITPPIGTLINAWSGHNGALQMLIDLLNKAEIK